MSSDDSTGGPPRGQTRVPIDAEVQLEFENFSGFIREVSANLSLGGMFVKTRYLKPVGTIVRFEFRLSDQYRLIRGSGEVVWTRWRDQPPAMPAGMGIQFLDLDAESRSLVNAIVEQHERAGGSPFDLESQAELEGASRSPSGSAPFAAPLPAASGAGVSSAEVSNWLRAESGSAPEASGEARWPTDEEGPRAMGQQVEIFTPPETAAPGHEAPAFDLPETSNLSDPSAPELEVNFAELPDLPEVPAVPDEPPPTSPDDTTSWGFAPRQGIGQARALDWGAAEAMAALGIATSAPLAAAAPEAIAPREPVEVPSPIAVPAPPPPRFGGGQAAHSDDGSRRVLWAVASVAVVLFAVGGWWVFRGRQASQPAPASAAQQRPAPTPAPAAVAPSPAPAASAPAVQPAPANAPASAATPPEVPAASRPETPPAPAPTPVAAPAAETPAARPAASLPAPVVSAPAAPPVAAVARFSGVTSITWQARGGETEVAIATNGSVSTDDVESTRLEKPEPRELVKLKGVRPGFNQTKFEPKTPELRQIRVGFHQEGAQGQLHIVLDLASPDVRVLSVRADGSVVRVRLGRS